MGLERLISGILSTSILLSGGNTPTDAPSTIIEETNEEKKLALILISNYDETNTFEGIEETFWEDFEDIGNYEIAMRRIDDILDIKRSIRYYSQYKSIDALVLAFHGSPNAMNINKDESLTTENFESNFEEFHQYLDSEGVVLLYSCSTGSGTYSIAEEVSKVFRIDVEAPRYDMIPENCMPSYERMGEFVLKENRLSFDIENSDLFKHYNIHPMPYFGKAKYLRGEVVAMNTYEGKIEFEKIESEESDRFLIIDYKSPEEIHSEFSED